MALLRPLLLDNVPSIQQSAALALGRLANYSDELAEAVVSNEILPQLVYSLSEQNVSICQLSVHKFKFYCSVFTKKRRPTFFVQLPSTRLTLLRQSLTQEHSMHWLTASRNLIHQLRKLQLWRFLASLNTTRTLHSLSLMQVQSAFWSFVSRSPN